MLSKKYSITTMVTIALVTITTCLLCVFTSINYFTSKSRELKALQDFLNMEADRIAISLTLPVWNFDRPQIENIVESIMHDSTVFGLVIKTANSDTILSARNRDENWAVQKVEKEFPVVDFLVQKRTISLLDKTLATVTLYATSKFEAQRLKRSFLWTIGSIFLLDLVLILSIFLLLRFWVFKPLRQVKAYAAAVTAGFRTKPSHGFYGELEDLRESLEQMVGQLDSRHAQVQREISEREKAEIDLIEGEAKYRTLFESAGDAIIIAENGIIIECNRRTEELFGCQRQALIGFPTLKLIEPVQPDGSTAESIVAHTRKIALSGKSLSMEMLMRRKDLSNFFSDCSLNESSLKGKSVVQVVVRDISDRKQAENLLRISEANLSVTLQSIGDAVIATDAAGKITRMNDTAERMTGWKLTEAKGRRLTEAFHIVNSKTREPSVNPVELVLEKGQIVGLANHTALISRDGKEFQISDSAAPIRNANGLIVGVVLVFSDVTEEYHIQESLQASTDLLQRTGNIAKIGGWDLDLKTMKLYWSQETCRIFEIENDIAPSVTEAINYYAPESQPIITEAVKNAIDHGTPYDVELKLITAKGRHIWTRSIGSAILEDGKVVKLIGAFQDITAHKLAEAALNEERELTQTYLNVIETMVIALNAKGEITSINRKGCELLGWDEKDLLGRSWFSTCLPQPEGLETVFPFFLRLMSGELAGTEYLENPVVTRNGELREIAWHNAILKDRQGVIVGTLSSGEDITIRKKAEEALRQVTERLSLATRAGGVGVWDFDLVLDRLTWDEQMFKLYGVSSEQFGGAYQAWKSGLYPADQAFAEAEVDKAIRGEKDFDTEFRVLWPNGTIRNIRALGVVQRDTSGNPIRMLGTNWDITEFKQAQENLRLHQQQLLQADKMNSLGMMVSGVAHEINNPNNLIMLNADVLETIWGHLAPVLREHSNKTPAWKVANIPYEKAESQIETLIRGLAGGSKRIKRIVDNLKDFARIDTGEISESIAISKVIEAAVSIVDNLIRKSTDNFSINHGDNVPRIKGNFQKLEQVVINLITNACQSLENRTKAITIVTDFDAEQGKVVLRVEDEGRGISPELLGKIADPFFTTKRDQGGTGLGLSVSYGIIKEHNGEIHFKSEVNRGTSVVIKIPASIDRT